MRIGSNIPSLSIANRLTQTTKAIQRSLERLSSGARVNSARDDAAAFSMSIGLDSQVRGLKQGLLNINQAQGMLQVADSAYQSQLDLIQRMREIAVQASNGTLSTSDRSALNEELSTLVEEFQRISTSTEWNGHKLLDGSFGTLSVFSGLSSTASIDQAFENSQSNQIFRKTAGTGAYSLSQTLSGLTFSRRADASDVNNDGHLDLVYVNFSTEVVDVRLGNGDGSFQNSITSYVLDIGSANSDLALADLNGDGLMDLVTPSSTGGVTISFGQGDGRFQFQSTYGSIDNVDYVELADMDQDGDIDAVASETSTGVLFVYLNNGAGAFSLGKSMAPSQASQTIAIADFNGDGRNDIATSAISNGLSVMYNQGNMNFTESTFGGGSFAGVNSVIAGDIDNDGDIDVGFQDYFTSQYRFWKNQNGSFTTSNISLALGGADLLDSKFVDINNDGFLDLLAANSGFSGALVSLNQGNGTFTSFQTYGPWDATVPVTGGAIGDFNGDGIPDLALAMRNVSDTGIYLATTTDTTALVDLNVSTQAKAQKLIGILDTALTNIMDRRADISALHNRLDSEASASLMLSENLSDALSKSKDVDVAEETAELVRNQILQQAQIAVLAQANVSMQVVLELFR